MIFSKTYKKFFGCLFISIIALSFSSCMKKEVKNEKIGILIKNETEPFWIGFRDSFLKAANENNYDIEIYASDNDSATQIDQLKTLLMNGVRGFVVTAATTDLTDQIAKIVNSQDAYVVFVNVVPTVSALKVGKNIYYSSSPETDAGAFQADIFDSYIKKSSGKINGKNLNIVYFNGEFGHPAVLYRRTGFITEMEKLGYKLNLTQINANWSTESARGEMSMWLEKNNISNLDAIVSQNDDMALGAVDALLNGNYVDNPSKPASDTDGDGTALAVPVFGIDATEAGRKSMQNNQLYGTVLQNIDLQTETALEIISECFKNGTAIGYTTKNNIKGATAVTSEVPLTDASVLDQCFVVPFIPVTK